MYCPSVLIMPFGPGPYLMMFVAPKIKPIINPTAARYQRHPFNKSSVGFDVLPPIMAPILAARR